MVFNLIQALMYALLWISQSSPTIIRSSRVSLEDTQQASPKLLKTLETLGGLNYSHFFIFGVFIFDGGLV